MSDYHNFWNTDMKVGSLEINSLALNNCFSCRNVFLNDVNALSKKVFKDPFFSFFFFFFWSKTSKVRVVWTIRFCSNFTSMWYKHFSRNVWRDFWLPMSALAMVVGLGKSLLQKLIFRSGILCYHCIGSLKPKDSPYII